MVEELAVGGQLRDGRAGFGGEAVVILIVGNVKGFQIGGGGQRLAAGFLGVGPIGRQQRIGSLGVEVVANAFETCQREIWLWVDGDRRWDQLAPHLAQRVARRS